MASPLTIVAAKGGVDPAALAENAFVKTGERRYLLRGQDLVRGSLRRVTVTICPKCLADDIAAAPQLRPELAPYQRALWQISAVKTCQVHTVPLVVAVKDMTPSRLHDWSHHVSKVLPDLSRLAAEAGPRLLTGFETYVAMRVAHGSAQGGLLDTLPLYVAIAACELFGAVATLGRMPNLKKLTDEEWRVAGGAGFDILADGQAGIETFLEQLRTGLHPKRLRKLLEASGMLPEGSADLVDGNCLFDAQRASTLVLDASDGTRQIISDWTNYDGSAIWQPSAASIFAR